jgi:hypothetical protein
MDEFSFTAKYENLSRELKSAVSVSSAISTEEKTAMNGEALWDTGASCTVINERLAANIGLIPIAKTAVKTPSTPPGEEHLSNVYYINITLPNGATITNLRVCEGSSEQWDVLVGMDIINLGDFAVSNFSGKTFFTFRIPSFADADFVRDKAIRDSDMGGNH